ncbi:MAG: transcriptional repressor [Deltaproteobacteria bacterium]|nr:transcriptional repressor [Deltaproteobacteria bacterium]
MGYDAEREIFSRFLRESGKHRSTPERFAILEAVLQTQGHFDAEGLYYRMIADGAKVSKATVYNTLELLQAAGLVSKYRFAEKTSRYEKAFGRPHHHHMVCLSCGEIIEFVNEKLERIQEEVSSARGFRGQSYSLQIFGTCVKCTKT